MRLHSSWKIAMSEQVDSQQGVTDQEVVDELLERLATLQIRYMAAEENDDRGEEVELTVNLDSLTVLHRRLTELIQHVLVR